MNSKTTLHPRNKHKEKYDLSALISFNPPLKDFVFINKFGNESVDFHNPDAVKQLNLALLKKDYDIEFWDIPQGYLCPPIPGRVDYIHFLADILSSFNNGRVPSGSKIKGLDIGTGANCIYPLLGNHEYGWSFVGSDIDTTALSSASKIISKNSKLKGLINLRVQKNRNCFFQGVVSEHDFFDFSISNPPFHASAAAAKSANKKKNRQLNPKQSRRKNLNFGGQSNELWTPGGELQFIQNMIHESKLFSGSCFIFSSLVSKEDNIPDLIAILKKAKVTFSEITPMTQGNKKSRIISWSFLSEKQRKIWVDSRW